MDFFLSNRTPRACGDEGFGLILTGIRLDEDTYELAAHHVIHGQPDYRMQAYVERISGVGEKEARARFFNLVRLATTSEPKGGPRHFKLLAEATRRRPEKVVSVDALRIPVSPN